MVEKIYISLQPKNLMVFFTIRIDNEKNKHSYTIKSLTIMKTKFSNMLSIIAVFFVTSVVLISCEKDHIIDLPYLNVSARYLTFYHGDTAAKTVNVNSTVDWDYEVSQSWAHISKNGNSLEVTVDPNLTTNSRSCELKINATSDKKLNELISITQESSLATVSSDACEINFDSNEGSCQTVSIKSNGAWTVQTPDWLRPAVSRGFGNMSLSFSTLSANKASTPRRATIIIKTDDQTLRLDACQYGSSATGCSVRPLHITTLANGIAFDFDYSSAGKVAHFFCGYMEASRSGSMTNPEIISVLKRDFQRHLPADDDVMDFAGLKAGTSYIVYTLAYDYEGKQGELIATTISTNQTMTNEPCAWISDMDCSSNRWTWSITKSATCFSYFMMSTENREFAEASDVLQAFWIDDAIRRNHISDYFNGGEWYMNRTTNVVGVWTRGRLSNGTLAGKICWDGISANSTRACSPKDTNEKNRIGDHSGKKLKDSEFKLYKID